MILREYTADYFTPLFKGSGVKKSINIHGQESKPNSQLWYCPRCGDIHVKVVTRIAMYENRYISVCNECEKCTKGNLLIAKTHLTLPGSILMEGYNTIDELSEEMLRRELLLELRAMKLLINQGVL